MSFGSSRMLDNMSLMMITSIKTWCPSWFDWCKVISSSWPLVDLLKISYVWYLLAADRPDCQYQLAAGRLTQHYQFQLAAGLTGARLSVPAGRWLTGSSSWPLVDWLKISYVWYLLAADSPDCQYQLAAGRLMHDFQFQASSWPLVWLVQDFQLRLAAGWLVAR